MADANTHIRVHRLKELDVPEALINGNKFIKWDEVSQNGLRLLNVNLGCKPYPASRMDMML